MDSFPSFRNGSPQPFAFTGSMGGLTDALIEEQAFRQEFEEAVRAEIKHVPFQTKGGRGG